ncbi:transcription antitermination factor NusB [Butyrivibrio sp. MC2013]|uniref:transcription antitermination factor NusB n=1 Tax=Butyrivibrio sp. MC2013 TaxID=1280686 RepID=UPI000413C927|nr:transcription antitermination factor NusB [Butyrivibrio sp. MC2013]
MKRSVVREQVFKLLFRVEFNDMSEMPEQEDLFSRDLPESDDLFMTSDKVRLSEAEADLVMGRYEKVAEKLAKIDKMINEKTKGWDTERMGKVELTIIRLAVFEICFDDDIPSSVAINEAVELAKKYGQDGSPAFVNGVLAKFV